MKMAAEKSRRSFACLAGVALLAFLAVPVPARAQAQTPGTVAIVGGQLIDGHGGPPLHRSVVIIEGSKIKTVGVEGQTAIPAAAKIIDAHGKTVMPGLIDMHVHLVLLGGGVPYPQWQWGPEWKGPNRTLEIMKISAHQLLMHGVTTVRDVGGDTKLSVDFRDAINAGKDVGPRLFVTGAFISRACNYAAQPAFCTQITSPEEAAAAAKQRLAAGVDWVKAWGMQPADIKALAEVTHQAGKRVSLHWVGALMQDYGLIPGDSLEHWQALTPSVIEKIAQSGVWVVPTMMTVGAYKLTEEFPERLDDPEFKKEVPADLYKMMYDYSVNFQRLNYFATAHSRLNLAPDTMRQMVNSSFAGRLLVGTDAGTALNFNSDTTREEAKLFVKWGGMTPLEAISAATRLPAQALGRGDDFGAVDPGKYADIIVVDGNPLEDMALLKNVVHVFKEGVQYK
jgi:imidazolonepropionase-like amidohydrolase